MGKKFDTEPETPGDDDAIESIAGRQLEQKIAALESRIKQLEQKIASSVVDPAFRSAIDKDDTSWMKNEKSLGRIAGVIPNPIIGLRERLDDDVS